MVEYLATRQSVSGTAAEDGSVLRRTFFRIPFSFDYFFLVLSIKRQISVRDRRLAAEPICRSRCHMVVLKFGARNSHSEVKITAASFEPYPSIFYV